MSLKKIELLRDVSLKDCTTIKIGGQAQNFFVAHTVDDLCQIIGDCGTDVYFLGGGSNLLVTDDVVRVPVVRWGEEFDYIRNSGTFIEVGAGTPFSSLIQYCIENNLSGLESLAGIPATVGGMVAANASSFGSEISSFLVRVEVVDSQGNIKQLPRQDIRFSYRHSSLEPDIVVRVWFCLSPHRFPVVGQCGIRPRQAAQEGSVRERVVWFMEKRKATQEYSYPSCGCVFKNAQTQPAGQLIELCGLKGLRKNDAQVSGKHANFIVNLGKASYSDVDYLTATIKDEVYKKHKVILEEEIKRWI